MALQAPLLFSPATTARFAAKVAQQAGLALSPLEERAFEDGEHKIRPLCSVRGRSAFVIQSLHGEPGVSPNDKLCRLLFLIGALRDAGASTVVAVVPYLAYARKDQRSQPRDPLTSRYTAQLLESVGTSAVVTLEVHNRAALQNAFRCPVVNLSTASLLAQRIAAWLEDRAACIVSPDIGGIKRAQALRQRLSALTGRSVSAAFLEKYRALGEVSGGALVGDVAGADVILPDDLISTGGTLARAAAACRHAGAGRVAACVCHGLFVGEAESTLDQAQIDTLMVTDTVPPFRLSEDFIDRRLQIVSVAPLLAQTIQRLHSGGSVVELIDSAV